MRSTIRQAVPLPIWRALLTLMTLAALGAPNPVRGQEGATPPHWIWHPNQAPNTSKSFPAEARYFRHGFSVKEPSRLALDVTADNAVTLYLDGKEIARADDWHVANHVETNIATGPHVLAAVATNEAPGAAGLLVRGGILPLGQGVPIHTTAAWKSAARVPDGLGWTQVDFDDSSWTNAVDLGVLGTPPWTGLVFENDDASDRYKVPDGFDVAMVAAPKITGSVVAFTFDPEGRPCVSVEGGPISVLIDVDKNGQYEESKVISAKITNSQGLAFIRDHLYAVGNGPQGAGLYRLSDPDRDGVFESIDLIRTTKGGMGEHGPHAVMLGPDGALWFNSGNHAHLNEPIDPRSPVNAAFNYEGELLPHYNDARGHAAGIMAPGGEILRSTDDGKTWQRVVAGFRNEYDFAFNRDGEIFSFDSDMEWDIGLPWYRPVRVVHGVPGAEFGWRNGSGKWPSYYFDSLPAALDVGRGSPTGVAFYQGNHFPESYDDNFLICDWSQGRILAVELKPKGATYEANAKELVTGQPLNCTDVEVGPDGAVYFSTGGRRTLGGLYRVAWTNAKPTLNDPKAGKPDLLGDALAMDSPLSSFSQRRLAQIRVAMGDDWGAKLTETASNPEAPTASRLRALDLLTQFSPQMGDDLLISLTKSDNADVAARALLLLGSRTSEPAHHAVVASLAADSPTVRRRACEALVRHQGSIPVEKLLPLLGDDDRWVRYAARVAIEHADDLAAHRDQILNTRDARPLIQGMLALVRATKLNEESQNDLFKRQVELLKGRIELHDFLDLTRLISLTYLLGPQKAADAPASAELRERLLRPFVTLPPMREQRVVSPDTGGAVEASDAPSTLLAVRREIARLLAYLDEPGAIDPILQMQADDPDHANQIHYAYCLRAIKSGWTDQQKSRLWAWYEKASHYDGGFSFLGYLDFMTQELVSLLNPEERTVLLAQGNQYPFPTRVLVRSIDMAAHPERVKDLTALYARLDPSTNISAVNDLRAQIIDALGRSEQPETHAALRDLATTDPGRRELVARALAAHPTADDLPIFLAVLDARDPNTTAAALNALTRIDQTPDDGPAPLRALIRLAQRTGPKSLAPLNTLAARWTKADPPTPKTPFPAALKHWETVYAERYPQGPALYDATPTEDHHYTLKQLVAEVVQAGLVKTASPERGKVVLEKAKCLTCHKLGDQGQGLGPDLTTVSSRFRPEEILESIVEPSKVISDQYKAVTVATTDGQVFNGMPTAGPADKLVLLLSDGTTTTIPKTDVEAQKDSTTSVMPDGLINTLSLQEIADLLALFDAQPRVEATQTSPKKE